MASQLQRQIYQAYLDAGLSANQAKIITAEVGRENSFNPDTVFGIHSDPKNNATNLGMLSWQGSRGRSLLNHLSSRGLIQNGSIVRNQAALNEMARFSVNEMRNNKSYSQTANTFLNNPNIDYQTGSAVLGRNYIRWRYDDPRYKSGHANRDYFYQAMGGKMAGESTNQQLGKQQNRFLSQDQIAKVLPQLAGKGVTKLQPVGQSRFLSSDQIAKVLPQLAARSAFQSQATPQDRFLSQDQIAKVLPQLIQGG